MKFVALPQGGEGSPFFVRPRRFYEDPVLGFRYYCDRVSSGTARMFLVESYQGGKLIQAEFGQKLIYATRETYHEIEDLDQIARLQGMLKKLRQPAQASRQSEEVATARVRRLPMRCWAFLLGATVSMAAGWAAGLTTSSESMPPLAWAACGGFAGLLGRIGAERRRKSPVAARRG